ncbi:MAG: PEP-CTERM sorting domain-containing protein [Coleofasciculus sp. G3-WIS-01]|uniref:PEP-CTERM sorting domain-containing protein n=1 Tax=Coleofasciculus sp. G3-WIS-01 TaxID=3069528 RepID=UPI0032FE68F1
MTTITKKSVAPLLMATATGTTTLLLSFSGSAQAALIDFETLPDGITTPTDNAALTNSYTVNGTTVTFGFDTNGDLTIDADAAFESRNDSINTGVSYTHGSSPDLDRTATNEGGDWLLRSPGGVDFLNVFDSADFIVKYTGAPATSASGQLWDIDAGEIYSIEAFDSTGTIISSITTPPIPGGEGPNTLSGLPYDFSFSNLSSDIGSIRISGVERIGGGGFAFDNFNATQSTVNPEPVPEPLTILGSATALGFGGLLKRQHSQKQKQKKDK